MNILFAYPTCFNPDMIWSCSLFLLLLILVMNIIAKNVARKWKI